MILTGRKTSKSNLEEKLSYITPYILPCNEICMTKC